jgi:hypothetical protein
VLLTDVLSSSPKRLGFQIEFFYGAHHLVASSCEDIRVIPAVDFDFDLMAELDFDVLYNAVRRYCSISFKSTPGVTRDPKNQFDISTTAKIWRDTSKIFDIGAKIWAFLCLTANF